MDSRHKKCWTADRLARKGLNHPAACPLCGQAGETIDHLPVSCVFSRQVWFAVLQGLGLQTLAPQVVDLSFEDWRTAVSNRVTGQVQKGLNSIIIQGACGSTTIAVCLMESLLVYTVFWQPSKKRRISGRSLELEGFLTSSPLPLRWFWSCVLFGLVYFLLIET